MGKGLCEPSASVARRGRSNAAGMRWGRTFCRGKAGRAVHGGTRKKSLGAALRPDKTGGCWGFFHPFENIVLASVFSSIDTSTVCFHKAWDSTLTKRHLPP